MQHIQFLSMTCSNSLAVAAWTRQVSFDRLEAEAFQEAKNRLRIRDAENLAIRFNQTSPAMLPLAKWPRLALFNQMLTDKEIADWPVQITKEGIIAAKQDQLRYVRTDVSRSRIDVSIGDPRNAAANLMNHWNLIWTVRKRNFDEKSVELFSFMTNGKAASKDQLTPRFS